MLDTPNNKPTGHDDEPTGDEGAITITGPVKMASIGAGATMMLIGVAGLIVSVRAVVHAALVAMFFAGLLALLYGAISAYVAVMRHQAHLRRAIEDAADDRHRHLDEQLADLRDTVEHQSKLIGEFLEHLGELALTWREDELGHRRTHRSV